MSGARSIVEGILKGRFSFLLSMQALLLLVIPILPGDQSFIDKMIGVLSLVILVSCLRAISVSRRFLIFMTLLTIINVGIGGTEIFSNQDSHGFRTIVLVFKLLYFGLVFLSIMRYVLDDTKVTADKMCGAISAYLMIGIIGGFIFTLFYHIQPASFSVPPELVSTETVNGYWPLYFSFTTLTTLGYGDITPKTTAAQSYAFMEAAFGQVFLAVIVARLVALQITHGGVPNRD